MHSYRRIFFVTPVILLICLTASAALAGYQYCPFCGKELEGKDYAYCPFCGKKLESSDNGSGIGTLGTSGSLNARVFEINPAVQMSHGRATITWTDSADAGPYYVAYRYADGNVDNQQLYWAGDVKESSMAQSKSFTCNNLIPGHSYDILVVDRDEREVMGRVNVPEAPTFVDGKLQASSLKVRLQPRYLPRSSGDASKAKSLNKFVSSQMDFVSNYYGLRLEIGHPQLGKERHYPTLIGFYAPNTYAWSYYDPDFNMATFQNGGSTYYYCVGTFFFDSLKDKFGGVPRGSYTVEVYFDGMAVGSGTFSVE